MDRMDFTHAVARIRVIEKRLLDKIKIERMLEANTPSEVLKVLQETQYGELISNYNNYHDFENILKEELRALYNNMYKISPDKSILDILTLKYDYHNIKVLLKGKIQDKDFSNLLISIGTVSIDSLKNSIISDELKDLPDMMRTAIVHVIKDFSDNKNPQNIDIILDKYMFADMLKRAEDSKEDFLITYIKNLIDISNIKAMLRVKKQNNDSRFLQFVIIDGGNIPQTSLLKGLNNSFEDFMNEISRFEYSKPLKNSLDSYNKTGNISIIEVLYDNYLINSLKKAKFVNFGAEPLIAYIIAKEMEIKIVRIIMIGKINNMPANIIKERLRDLYA